MPEPERASDSQRERIARLLEACKMFAEITENMWTIGFDRKRFLDAIHAAEQPDAMLAAREGDGYEGIANDLARELAAARDRIAQLEEALGRGCGVCCALLGPPASDPAPTAGRSAP